MAVSIKSQFTFIDLFSGIGGFHKALITHGGECKGYSEINKDAIDTYCENFNESKEHNFGDITKIDSLPRHDLLTAGVPCQSWSIAGKNLGFNDDRGQLWNDTIYFLEKSQPKAFIFENVKGLVDPRNKEALEYILKRIKEAGYHAKYFVVNSFDYGVPQNRVRIYIVGFKEEKFFNSFQLPNPVDKKVKLCDVLGINLKEMDFISKHKKTKQMSLSASNGYNDYFLFNDLRNGKTTIHSWDIIKTTAREKDICYLLLKNRRKSLYGKQDGNPLSLEHFQSLDSSVKESELEALISLEIFKKVEYKYTINKKDIYTKNLTDEERLFIEDLTDNEITLDALKKHSKLKHYRMTLNKVIDSLKSKNIFKPIEYRYEFKNSKISTGLFGINRIFLPSSYTFPTLVASDTNDYITLEEIIPSSDDTYKKEFLEKVYLSENYRKITKEEACLIQGFPRDFKLPQPRNRWMKLIGNSVSVPVIEMLCKSILRTGVFEVATKKETFLNELSA